MTDALELDLVEELGSFAYDPVGFVYWAFPWGEVNTELANEAGPDEWQLWVLENLRDGTLDVSSAIQLAVTSGHGIGKSALVAWIVLWAFSTFVGTRGVVTANTENQLKTKTWVEIAKWHRLFIARDLFKCTATALFSVDEERAREWRLDIVPWSEKNTEAFAGLHNAGKRLLIVFDEASAIPDLIWETTEGALTDEDTEIIWAVFGNPTRTTGRFRECFPGGKFAHRWITREVDSRTVRRTNKEQLNNWVEDYGEDSDFVRVRVLGKFPRVDAQSFISAGLVDGAVGRAIQNNDYPYVLGVDVARFGNDASCIYPRAGRDASSVPPRILRGVSTMVLVSEVIRVFHELNAVMIFVDTGGVGAGVFDRLAELGYPVVEVSFGSSPDGSNVKDPSVRYLNKRSEIWGGMRDFLATGSIPETIPGLDRSFREELMAPSYTINSKTKIVLEPKDMIKKRLGFSPDAADALATTFAYPLSLDELRGMARDTLLGGKSQAENPDYNPFAMEA